MIKYCGSILLESELEIMKNILISVIVPFYKGEKYIQHAVQSVLRQPYRNFELILINDGSPDNDENICDKIAACDFRVKYYKKENEGIGATRNFGIEKASGDYIAFLDQDDVWCNNFCNEQLVNYLIDGPDVVAFSYCVTNEDLTRGKCVTVTEKIINGGYDAVKLCWNHHSSMFYRREFLKKNRIGYALTRHEDVIFLQKALYLAENVRFVNKLMFCYRNNPASETHSKKSPESLYVPILNSWLELLNWHETFDSVNTDIIRLIKNMICIYAMEGIEAMYQYGMTDRKINEIVKKNFPLDILMQYQEIMDNDWRKQKWKQWFENHSNFVKKQSWMRFKNSLLKMIKRIPGMRGIYVQIKYPEVLTQEIILH